MTDNNRNEQINYITSKRDMTEEEKAILSAITFVEICTGLGYFLTVGSLVIDAPILEKITFGALAVGSLISYILLKKEQKRLKKENDKKEENNIININSLERKKIKN